MYGVIESARQPKFIFVSLKRVVHWLLRMFLSFLIQFKLFYHCSKKLLWKLFIGFWNRYFCTFDRMNTEKDLDSRVIGSVISSSYLKRDVIIDFYLPGGISDYTEASLLLINDGQDLPQLNLQAILDQLYASKSLLPMVFVGITAGPERKSEYGVAAQPDYLGRGDRANQYTHFIVDELLPTIYSKLEVSHFKDIGFAGFSLGGLSALDIVWNYPQIFSKVGVFSGSLWWRSKDQDDVSYSDDADRIMQQQIRNAALRPGLQFFFQCGALDEAQDRNKNGIIDAIDDTRDHVQELLKKGYRPEDIAYLELDDGRHDVATWGKAMPVFLKWGWGIR